MKKGKKALVHLLLEKSGPREILMLVSFSFQEAYGFELQAAREALASAAERGVLEIKPERLADAWEVYYKVFRRLAAHLKDIRTYDLKCGFFVRIGNCGRYRSTTVLLSQAPVSSPLSVSRLASCYTWCLQPEKTQGCGSHRRLSRIASRAFCEYLQCHMTAF